MLKSCVDGSLLLVSDPPARQGGTTDGAHRKSSDAVTDMNGV